MVWNGQAGGDKEGGNRGITEAQTLKGQESREGVTQGQSKADVAPEGQGAYIQQRRGGRKTVEGDNEEGDGRRRVISGASEGSQRHGQGRSKTEEG